MTKTISAKLISVNMKKSELQRKEYPADVEGLESFINDARNVLNLQDLCKDKRTKHFKKKSDIFMEGDLPNNMYFVKSGSVKTYKTNLDGKEFITNLYK